MVKHMPRDSEVVGWTALGTGPFSIINMIEQAELLLTSLQLPIVRYYYHYCTVNLPQGEKLVRPERPN